MKKIRILVLILVFSMLALCSCASSNEAKVSDHTSKEVTAKSESDIPDFSGTSILILNENEPDFTKKEKENTDSYENYSSRDSRNRCGVAEACIGSDLMPTEERGSIGMVKPSGWHTVKYNGLVEGNYLYNRCHLIMYALTGENDNEDNLITGTRYFNASEEGGMLKYEMKVLNYMESHPDRHVMYRVTPVFEGNDLVAKGVEMEAYSVEDEGRGVQFHVFIYNVQPGIAIDYSNGDSWIDESLTVNGESVDRDDYISDGNEAEKTNKGTYVLNKNTKKFHYPDCSSVNQMKESNRVYVEDTPEHLEEEGYDPCGNCRP